MRLRVPEYQFHAIYAEVPTLRVDLGVLSRHHKDRLTRPPDVARRDVRARRRCITSRRDWSLDRAVLSFTAEDIWRLMPRGQGGSASLFLSTLHDCAFESLWADWLSHVGLRADSAAGVIPCASGWRRRPPRMGRAKSIAMSTPATRTACSCDDSALPDHHVRGAAFI